MGVGASGGLVVLLLSLCVSDLARHVDIHRCLRGSGTGIVTSPNKRKTMDTDTIERNGHSGVILCSFLFGAAAGSAIALLLAPTPGEEIRSRLKTKVQERRDRAAKVVERGREAGRDVVERARTHVKDQAEHASRALAEGKTALADIRQRGEQAVKNVRQEVTDAVEDAKTASKDVRSAAKAAIKKG